MSYRSRGCQRCRQRRVKCDEGRPSCQRCVTRNELCVGYKDDLDIFFQDQTAKVVQNGAFRFQGSRARSKSVQQLRPLTTLNQPSGELPSRLPWLNMSSSQSGGHSLEDEAVSKFIDKFVIYPCAESSSSGFLEHLPNLFKDGNVTGRYALRWAVQATAFADLSKSGDHDNAATQALEYYGRSLAALERSLAKVDKAPDDYDLMTVTLFLAEEPLRGSHAQGMAHILRLRGHEQFHDPRGWGLFRLAHHRLQKERLAKHMDPLSESQDWLDALDSDIPFVKLEKSALKIAQVCSRAREVLQQLKSSTSLWEEIIELVSEMHSIDQENALWRQGPEWSFRTVSKKELLDETDKADTTGVIDLLPETIEIHRDLWMAYEWNYHRTARIILHRQLIECLSQASRRSTQDSPDFSRTKVNKWMNLSIQTVQLLVDQILSTVPQSLGDVDCLGHCRGKDVGPPLSQTIGAYLLLWPVRVIMGPKSNVTEVQRRRARAVFERIRECTGMKSQLGALSNIQDTD